MFLSTLHSLPSSTAILMLATSECPWDELPAALREVFEGVRNACTCTVCEKIDVQYILIFSSLFLLAFFPSPSSLLLFFLLPSPPLPASSFSPTFLLPSSYLLPTFPPSPPSHPLSLPSPQVSSKSFAVHPPSLEQRKLFFFPVLLTRPTQPPPPKPRPCSGKITDEPPF